MRHHNFIQKKVLNYINDFFFKYIENNVEASSEIKSRWNEFLEEIINFDTYDNYIDHLIKDNDRVVVLQYFYSHVDDDGNLSTLEKVSERNIWIKDNMIYYKDIEKMMSCYFDK